MAVRYFRAMIHSRYPLPIGFEGGPVSCARADVNSPLSVILRNLIKGRSFFFLDGFDLDLLMGRWICYESWIVINSGCCKTHEEL